MATRVGSIKPRGPRGRTERLEARITPELKERFSRAAALEGKTLTEFMLDHLDRAAQRTLEASQAWELSRRDQEALVDALLSPPDPNAALREAARRYQGRARS